MTEAGIASQEDINEVDARIGTEVEAAAAFAEAGTPAGPGLAPSLVFAGGEAG